MNNLLRVLERHPEEVEELRKLVNFGPASTGLCSRPIRRFQKNVGIAIEMRIAQAKQTVAVLRTQAAFTIFRATHIVIASRIPSLSSIWMRLRDGLLPVRIREPRELARMPH